MRTRPDLLVLSGVSSANASQLIRSARELGFEGVISTETAQDAGVLAMLDSILTRFPRLKERYSQASGT